jgi:hypothetical protein
MSIPVARLDCTYDTKRLSGDKEQTVCYSHFDQKSYDQHTDICIGTRVAISNMNFLPEIGLYKKAIGDVIEICTTATIAQVQNKKIKFKIICSILKFYFIIY